MHHCGIWKLSINIYFQLLCRKMWNPRLYSTNFQHCSLVSTRFIEVVQLSLKFNRYFCFPLYRSSGSRAMGPSTFGCFMGSVGLHPGPNYPGPGPPGHFASSITSTKKKWSSKGAVDKARHYLLGGGICCKMAKLWPAVSQVLWSYLWNWAGVFLTIVYPAYSSHQMLYVLDSFLF